jgi:hypothetical protein
MGENAQTNFFKVVSKGKITMLIKTNIRKNNLKSQIILILKTLRTLKKEKKSCTENHL